MSKNPKNLMTNIKHPELKVNNDTQAMAREYSKKSHSKKCSHISGPHQGH